MENLKLKSLIHALGTGAYVAIVATMLQNGGRIFGEMDNKFLGPIAFLLLFVTSAAITGALVIGKPILMYLDNKKSDAVKMFLYTVGWLFLMIVLLFVVQVLIKQ